MKPREDIQVLHELVWNRIDNGIELKESLLLDQIFNILWFKRQFRLCSRYAQVALSSFLGTVAVLPMPST